MTSAGGAPTVLTKPNREAGEVDHLYPQFLPGSQAVLFTITSATGSIDASQVAVLDLRNGAQKVVMRGGSQARYVPSGHLVYVADGTLRAVAFDLERLEVTGTAVQVVPQVLRLPTGTAEFDIADDGTLVYVASGVNATPARTLVWVDRQGREEDIKGAPARAYVGPRLSPDGTRAALEVRDQENDIWVWDFGRATLTRVTSDPGLDQSPVWMPDGGRLVFSSDAGGFSGSIFWRASDGTGTAERLTESTNIQRPSSVTADGTRVLFWHAASGTGSDVMMATLEKDARVQPLVQTQFVERNGEVSPDGHRLAYESNDSGQFEMAVRPFPDVNKGKWQVSTAGGAQPLWAKNGQELFYLAPNGAVMSLPVQSAATWTAGVPTKLFEGPYFRGTGNNLSTVGRTYDVSPDGRRFLMIKPGGAADQTAPPPTIVVVQHWFDELKRLVPRTR